MNQSARPREEIMQSLIAVVAFGLFMLFSGCATSNLSLPTNGSDPDASLASEIYGRLKNDNQLRHLAVGIDVMDGIVTVYGTVSSPSERARTLSVVRNTTGVKQVIDRLVE